MSHTDASVSFAVLELGAADLSDCETGPERLSGLRWQHQSPRDQHRRTPAGQGHAEPSGRATTPPWHSVVRSIVSQLEHTDNRVGQSPTERPAAYLVIVRSAPPSTPALAERNSVGAPSTGWRPGPVDRAIKIMEADPAAISSTADLARAANVAVRTLQSAFRQHTGNSPMQYLRELRLARVHQDLLAADPRKHTVARIAHRHGFTHLGRFAAAYRARYGRNPSTTLQVSTGGWQPGGWQPGDWQPGDWQPGDWQPGDWQPGDWQRSA